MAGINADGLFVKYGRDTAQPSVGGEVSTLGGKHSYRFVINYTDCLSATPTVLDGPISGSNGILLPKGLFVEEVETVTEVAFTSSGTIGSANIQLGLIREDLSTTFDVDGLTATTFVGSLFDAAGEKQVLRIGSTGVGSAVGTTLANDGILIVANTAHATHPLTAGKMVVTIRGYFP